MSFSLNSYEGLTTDMDGFSYLFRHWRAGKIHFGLRDHTVTVSIPKLVSAINGGRSDPVLEKVFEAWRHGTFRRLLQSAGSAQIHDGPNRTFNRNTSFQVQIYSDTMLS
jgi:hypothetical protein